MKMTCENHGRRPGFAASAAITVSNEEIWSETTQGGRICVPIWSSSLRGHRASLPAELEAKATEDELRRRGCRARHRCPHGCAVACPQALPGASAARGVAIAAPTSCPCCGSMKLSKLGEDVTETLEIVPRP